MPTMPNKLLRLPEVREMTGLSTSRIYALMDEKLFPRPIRIGIRAVAWLKSDLDKWLDSLIADRDMREAA